MGSPWGSSTRAPCIVRRSVDAPDIFESPALAEDVGVHRLGGPVRGVVVAQAVEERGHVLAHHLGHGAEGAVGVARGDVGLGEPACVPGVGRLRPIWKGEIRVGRFIYTLSCWPLLAGD